MTAITTSISEVMETMCFLSVEPGPEMMFKESGIDKDAAIACRLQFTGDASGQLIMVSPIELTTQMAENFMGETRDQLTQEHLSGTLTEMLNMICGNALSKTDPSVPYELGIPELVSCSDLDGSAKFTVINTIDSKMAVSLVLENM